MAIKAARLDSDDLPSDRYQVTKCSGDRRNKTRLWQTVANSRTKSGQYVDRSTTHKVVMYGFLKFWLRVTTSYDCQVLYVVLSAFVPVPSYCRLARLAQLTKNAVKS